MIWIKILCLSFISTNNAVKIFLPNTNFWNSDNWAEHKIPCTGNHITFPKTIPKVFLNGVGSEYHVSEIILPVNGELVLDNLAILTAAVISNEEHDCDTSISHFNKVEPDHWYNPHNWCEALSMTSKCLIKPQIEASIVPSANDIVIFPLNNMFYIGIDPSEPKVLAKKIFFRGTMYSNSILFRQRVRRTFASKILEFLTINSTNPPQIELQGNLCRKLVCSTNSNLDKMQTICKYVKCKTPACNQQVKPEGSCCHICGHIVKIKLYITTNATCFSIWINNLIINGFQEKVGHDLLPTTSIDYQLVLTPMEKYLSDFDSLFMEIMTILKNKKKTMELEMVECVSCKPIKPQPVSQKSKIFQTVIWIIVLILFVLLVLFLINRFKPSLTNRIPSNWPTIPKFKFPKIRIPQFSNSFKKSRLDETLDDAKTYSSFSSIFPGGIEAIELPDTITEVSFDNPIYSAEIDDSKQ